uniref:CDP-diacylglycerol--inositol 3-phosphatidyltransferase n=1 Tax=Ictalurus punctatus TaxID=7998 RepID=E3TEZ7_ICTPU|nr:CDP-diacylglycerol--inositol 3-phosphatidyltransferase [Ictalurus punctatus]ADO28883.1 cdp-diacylglycerol--inositol 3-phosphatidyltransferase [Ictalurus punctatus]
MGENIFIFVPNIIGYVRIILLFYACWYMTTDLARTMAAYLLSALLDAFDGHAARLLDQSTRFGAMLDMLSDRCATMCLLFTLGTFYPRWQFVFQLSARIDIASHWLHVHTSSQRGAASHKAICLDGNPLLRIYYTNRLVLFAMCAGNEIFYSMLYILYFTEGPRVLGLGVYRWLLCVSCPIALVKTCISLVHLYAASLNLARMDVSEREARRSAAASAEASPQVAKSK